MKHTLCTLALLFVVNTAFSQQDSIKRQIEEYPFGSNALIAKGRHMLIDKFTTGDYSQVRNIVDYFDREFKDSTIIDLYPKERLLLYYWTNQYTKILGPEGQYKKTTPGEEHTLLFERKSATFLRDGLERLLEKRTTEQRDELCRKIDSAEFTSEERDFLKLNMLSTLTWDWDTTITRKEVNAKADTFLAEYPSSQYTQFVKQYIRIVYKPSKKGMAWEFFTGYGFFTARLHDDFRYVIPIGCAFDFYYRKYILYLRDYIGFSSTNRTIEYPSGQWVQGSAALVYLPELTIGYQVVDNRRMAWAPFAGIASTDISPTVNDMDSKPGYKDFDLGFTTTYTLGCNFDIKLAKSRIPMVDYHESSYWFLRIRYSYNIPQFRPGFEGNMHSITIGMGGMGRKLERDMP